LVGVRKVVLDFNEFLNLDFLNLSETGKELTAEETRLLARNLATLSTIQQLLRQYYVVEIWGVGSKEHVKAGLQKDKVLVKAYSKRLGEPKNE